MIFLSHTFYSAVSREERERVLGNHRKEIEATFISIPQIVAAYLVAHEDPEDGRHLGLSVEFAESAVPQPGVRDPMTKVICRISWLSREWLAPLPTLGVLIVNNLREPLGREHAQRVFSSSSCIYRREGEENVSG